MDIGSNTIFYLLFSVINAPNTTSSSATGFLTLWLGIYYSQLQGEFHSSWDNSYAKLTFQTLLHWNHIDVSVTRWNDRCCSLIGYQSAEFAKSPPFEKKKKPEQTQHFGVILIANLGKHVLVWHVYSKGEFYCCACFVVCMLVMFLHQSKLVL